VARIHKLRSLKPTCLKLNKTAAGTGSEARTSHITTEKQLADAKLEFHARTGQEPEGVTESKHQIGGSEQMNDVSV
jgi:hypothetical protein